MGGGKLPGNLVESRRAFSDLGFWPPQRAEINPEGWLSQFDLEDRTLAEELLETFTFFNQRYTNQLFFSAIHALSATSFDEPDSKSAWKLYRDNTLLTFPSTEDQNPTDSGHQFARLARDKFAFPQLNIFRPSDLIPHLRSRSGSVSVLFVDDILGSGEQFIDCWKEIVYFGNESTSLGQELDRLDARVEFAVAVATSVGVDELKENAPRVSVAAGSVLDPEELARHPRTRVVSEDRRRELEPFLVKYAERAGYDKGDIWGHKELATMIAFEHGVPDTTLPIFWHAENWIPLRRQT